MGWGRAFGYQLSHSTRKVPDAVMGFFVFNHGIVWVKHPSRGWEVPGGKVEVGESGEEALHREGLEEAGVRSSAVQWIGEYAYPHPKTGVTSIKWVYIARVEDVSARPRDFEIVDVACQYHWTPEVVRTRSDVSPVMMDDMYPTFWPLVATHL